MQIPLIIISVYLAGGLISASWFSYHSKYTEQKTTEIAPLVFAFWPFVIFINSLESLFAYFYNKGLERKRRLGKIHVN